MTENPRVLRRALMVERNAALAARDLSKFQALTAQIAALPMPGVPELTAREVQRWNERKANGKA